jgi:hypothetical protein
MVVAPWGGHPHTWHSDKPRGGTATPGRGRGEGSLALAAVDTEDPTPTPARRPGSCRGHRGKGRRHRRGTLQEGVGSRSATRLGSQLPLNPGTGVGPTPRQGPLYLKATLIPRRP